MGLRRENETQWEMVISCGERNEYDTITATKDGLDIGYYGEIPWRELDEARAIATGLCTVSDMAHDFATDKPSNDHGKWQTPQADVQFEPPVGRDAENK